MPPKKRSRGDASGGQQTAGAEEEEAKRKELCETLTNAVDEAFEGIGAERARLLAEATEAAAKVKEDAETEVEGMRRKVQEDRAALEQEKAAMEKAHTFQTNKICLDVGGHKFTTSRQTLTSVPNTYLSSMFSGRFALATDATDGAYFIDRDGKHFGHVLNFLRDPVSFTVSSDTTEAQRKELEVEVGFYGLLNRMMPEPEPGPYAALDFIGQFLLKRACLAGTARALRTAVAQSRVLVFKMGSTTPFLSEEFQDSRWVITDSVVKGSPVWAAEGGEWFMYRDVDNTMTISDETDCALGMDMGMGSDMCISNTEATADVVAPTELPSDKWVSIPYATLETQYASAERFQMAWARVPEMRITAVHGLDDDDPAMAEALAKLAALE
jgi:hypothetical protein